MQDFRQLQIWHKAHSLTQEIYRVTRSFPRQETYGLTAQMRSAAVSVPSNISEGCGRGGWPELIHFCQIAFGSLSELDYQLLLAHDLAYLSDESYRALDEATQELKRMMASFLRGLRARHGEITGRDRRGTVTAIQPPAQASNELKN